MSLLSADCSDLARDMQDDVGVVSGCLLQAFEGFRGRENDQFEPSLFSFALYRIHEGSAPVNPLPMISWRHFKGIFSSMETWLADDVFQGLITRWPRRFC